MSDQPDKQPQHPVDQPEKGDKAPPAEDKSKVSSSDSAAPSGGAAESDVKPVAAQPSANASQPIKPEEKLVKPESLTENQPSANAGQPQTPQPEEKQAKPDASIKPAPSGEKPDEDKSSQEGAKDKPPTASPTRKLEMPPPLSVPAKTTPPKPGESARPTVVKPLEPAPTQGPSTAPIPDSLLTGAAAKPAVPSAGQICPTCGHLNRPGILFCENCGTNLMTGKQPAIGTRDLKHGQEAATQDGVTLLDTSESKAVETAGSSTFTENMVLRVEIEGVTSPMLVYPKQEIILGRRDPNTGAMPDVDLTAYAGYRMGVSRRHAAIRFQDRQLNVSDLGSSNGTFLNGTRLNAHRPYQLRDGDEIRLGQMALRLFFQSNKK